MKSSTIAIISCVLFFFGWHYLVISPYNQQRNEAKREQVATESANKQSPPEGVNGQRAENFDQGSVDYVADPSVDPLDIQPEASSLRQVNTDTFMSLAMKDSELKEAVRHSTGEGVDVFFSKHGAVGNAVFQDFSIRGTDEQVVVLREGLRWVSSDAAVALCLANLEPGPALRPGHFIYSARQGGGRCVVEYQVDENNSSIQSSLLLEGFPQSSGFVEFRGRDDIGSGSALDHNTLMVQLEGSQSSAKDKELFGRGSFLGQVEWLVWGDKYFVNVMLPEGRFNPNVVFGGMTGNEVLKEEDRRISYALQYPILDATSGSLRYELRTAFLTRDQNKLAQLNPSMSRAVDLGWFGYIGRLMLWGLTNIYNLVNNFGVAIVILTIIIRVLFWPLNRKVFMAGLKMKALAPEVEKLKKKYGGDKSKMAEMNQEMMGLYKRHKVNPLGSCLPLLLQMPIFIGLYQALNNSVDLYQAPFMLWITDLSSRDPYFVFPVLWTVTLIGYVYLSPTQGAQQQGMPDMKWIMIVMNVFFGILSMSWPAGLTLYLFVSNLVGISQQFFFQRAHKLQPIQEGA